MTPTPETRTLAEADPCPFEAVFGDQRLPCLLSRGHEPPHKYTPQPAPETGTARIRWQDKPPVSGDVYLLASNGYVGTSKEPAFKIYRPDELHDNWLLSVRLTAGAKFAYADTPDKLKAEAEQWLDRFVSSLGASFGDAYEFPDGPPIE